MLTTAECGWCWRPVSPKSASQMRKERPAVSSWSTEVALLSLDPKLEVVLSPLWDGSLHGLCVEVNDGFSVALGHRGARGSAVNFQQGLWELRPWWRRQCWLRKTGLMYMTVSFNEIVECIAQWYCEGYFLSTWHKLVSPGKQET